MVLSSARSDRKLHPSRPPSPPGMINLYYADTSIMHEVMHGGAGRRLTVAFDLLVRGEESLAVKFLMEALRSKLGGFCQGQIDTIEWGPGTDTLPA